MISLGWQGVCPRVFMSCAGSRHGVTRHMSLVSSSCLELRAPPRLRVGCPAPGLQARWAGWLVFDRLPPRVCSAEQKECRPQGSVTPAQSPGEQLEEADCQALDPSPAHTPPAPAACIPESPTPGSSGQCAPLYPSVSPCLGVPPCVWVFPLVSGRAPLCLGVPPCVRVCPACPGVSPCIRVFPLASGRAPLCLGVSPCVRVFPLVRACTLVSGRAPLCPGVPRLSRCFPLSGCAPLCPGVSPCPGVPSCVWVFPLVRACPLVSGCALLCLGVSPCPGVPPCVQACALASGRAPLCPGVPRLSRCFPLSGCAPLYPSVSPCPVCPLDLVPLCLFS
ncbi:keratin-associated protein 10-12-like [Bos indicus]|uniref:Keratin-associated protein 10-12-like n=1 Tax=Bos indicus TaxID=9915 RepID=A0ABM4QSA6_BOSIN